MIFHELISTLKKLLWCVTLFKPTLLINIYFGDNFTQCSIIFHHDKDKDKDAFIGTKEFVLHIMMITQTNM